MLLVHGWGGRLASMNTLQELMSNNYETYNLELPGHGDTPEMNKPWNSEDFGKYIEQFLEKMNINNYIYIGHSFGGHLGMRICIEGKNKPKKLILINSSGLKPKNSFKKVLWKSLSNLIKPVARMIPENLEKSLKRFVYKYLIRERDYINTRGMLKESFKIIIEEHLSEESIQKIQTKTLLIWGRHDTYTPLWMSNKLNNLIPNSDLEIIEGTHGIPFQKPKSVSKIILNWLKEKI